MPDGQGIRAGLLRECAEVPLAYRVARKAPAGGRHDRLTSRANEFGEVDVRHQGRLAPMVIMRPFGAVVEIASTSILMRSCSVSRSFDVFMTAAVAAVSLPVSHESMVSLVLSMSNACVTLAI